MPRIASHPTYPSVTEVLKAVGLTRGSEHIPDRYRERGRAMHAAVEMYLAGLDVSGLAPELQPGLDAFADFQAKEGYVSLHSELELGHPYGFVGHLDLVGYLPEAPSVALLDTKYTDSPDLKGATLQLAGYRLLWNDRHPVEPSRDCYVLQLSPTSGKYKLHPVTDDYSMTIFTSALIVFNAREGK